MVEWDLRNAEIVHPDPKYGGKITKGQNFAVEVDLDNGPNKTYPLGKWALERPPAPSESARPFLPMQIYYHDPFFLHLKDLDKDSRSDWGPFWMVIDGPFTKDGWVVMGVTGKRKENQRVSSFDAAHPIHLHGHDFAILKVVQNGTATPFETANLQDLDLNNPTRRDSVLLPASGWVVIAFKADNPGSWIMHCHIAFHASEGLGMQISERQSAANEQWGNPWQNETFHPAITETERVCRAWQAFEFDCTKHWPGYDSVKKCYPACTNTDNGGDERYACKVEHKEKHYFQDDSGV